LWIGLIAFMAAPVLAFPEKSPPLAVFAAARLAGVAIEAKPDAKAAKDAPATLTFPSG
jgi:chromate transport protein ChrA